MAIPVFAKELVSLESIVGKTDNKEVVLNATDSIDLHFNDLNQKATYKVKLKNNTDDVLYVNDLVTEDLSEEFIEFSLTEKSEFRTFGEQIKVFLCITPYLTKSAL